MKSPLRLVYSSSEGAEDSLRLARVQETNSSSTRRLAVFARRLRLRGHVGDLLLGAIAGVVITLLLAIAGVFDG